jgi:hypothetical protein
MLSQHEVARMTHSKCGLLILFAAAGAAACGGDPTESFQQAGEKIVATPSVVFVDSGASVFVIAERRDVQGNQLAADFDRANVGSQMTVETDSSFLATTNGTNLKTRERFIVTGLQPGASSFNITSGDLSTTVPVSVLPTNIGATFSTTAPVANEPVIITLPAGYKFSAAAKVESSFGPGVVRSFSADSTSISALIIPGSNGPLQLSGIDFGGLPSLTLDSLPTAVVAAEPLIGSDTTTTAPAVTVPALNDSTIFLGSGPFDGVDITGDGGDGAHYFKLTVTEAGDYHFVTNWPGTDADLDAIVCFDTDCAVGEFAGLGTTQPEDGTLTLDPGTYYFAVVIFGPTPPFFTVSLTHLPPTGP